jgi:hypothetical protein
MLQATERAQPESSEFGLEVSDVVTSERQVVHQIARTRSMIRVHAPELGLELPFLRERRPAKLEQRSDQSASIS